MVWNWELADWPKFIFDAESIIPLEKKFLRGAGGGFAVLKHLNEENKRQFIVEILCTEGLKSAEIEGEILERESLQSSIQRHFGLSSEKKSIPPREQGMANLMWRMYETFDQTLTHEMLYEWHKLLMSNDSRSTDIGKYRTHDDPMQIVSNRYGNRTIYFEAPPSKIVHKEMTRFIDWFNKSKNNESLLARAAIAHLYFESIHPFEDGNSRIGRTLVGKALSENLGQPTLIAVSQVITKQKKDYYAALGSCNKTLDANKWVAFFSEVIVESQEESLMLINFLMDKSRVMNNLAGRINERQEKALLRMFSEGLKGFSEGLSAENYIAITKASRATATRDLSDLVEKGALTKTGRLRHTRYWLNIVKNN